jgi:hypothetical protein
MAFSRKHLIYAAAAPLTLGALLATTALPASAHVRPPVHPRVAVGSMELSGPLQYEQFRAVQGFGHHHNHGQVTYTNWTYGVPGSGVYAPQAGAHALDFTYQGVKYGHTLNGGLKLTAKSPDRLAFSGTGVYNAQAGATWKIAGFVDRTQLRAVIEYTGTLQPGYKVFLTGQVAADGSVTGNARSSQAQDLTFTMPIGAFASVLHYHAPIQSDRIGRHDATFQFTIPRYVDGLAGVKVTVKVHDGGWGRWHDTYAHGVTGTPLSPYPITGGPGVTVR